MNMFAGWWPELIVFLTAASPISELRGAIPLALGVYHLGVWKTFGLAIAGNTLPPLILIWTLGPISGFLISRFTLAQKFFDWLFTRTRHRFSGPYELWGELALMIFVAIPFPLTGAWTGSIAAFLFGIPKRRSLIFIFLGILIAGIIVTLTTLGVVSLI